MSCVLFICREGKNGRNWLTEEPTVEVILVRKTGGKAQPLHSMLQGSKLPYTQSALGQQSVMGEAQAYRVASPVAFLGVQLCTIGSCSHTPLRCDLGILATRTYFLTKG